LVIGLTVVAFGTSAPELAVCIKAAWNGADGIALGNVIGSNIANIALILGISAIVRPISIHGDILRSDSPLLILSSSTLIFMLMDGVLSQWEGGALFLAVVIYTIFKIKKSPDQPSPVKEIPETSGQEKKHQESSHGSSIALNVILILVGITLLVTGGNLLVSGASTLASLVGVSETVIGLTVVAVGTSVPELATSIVATLKNHADIALGNAIGSSLFNILAILGITASFFPLDATSVSGVDLGVFLGMAMVILPAMRTGFTLGRAEGFFLTASYILYVAYLAWAG
jgi:cation:H+ antiporter